MPLTALEPDDSRAVLELHAIAPLGAMQLVLPAMRVHGGAVVNVSWATSLRVCAGLGGLLVDQGRRSTCAPRSRGSSLPRRAWPYRSSARRSFAGGAHHIPVNPPELAAGAILLAIRGDDAHVLVGDPPRAIAPGSDDSWGALPVRQAPRLPAAGTPGR